MRKIVHGEVIFLEATSIPEGAKLLEVKDKYFVVCESETLGNDHRVEVLDDTLFYEKDGKLYIKNQSPIKVFCPNDSRHSKVEIPGSIWEHGIAQEYDYIEQMKRNVRD